MKKNATFLILALILLLAISACAGKDKEEPIMLGDPPTPEQTVRGFYTEYLEYASSGKLAAYYETGAYSAYPHLSQDFINFMDELSAQKADWSFDPILCSDQVPQTIRVTAAGLDGDNIILSIQTDLEDHSFKVRLTPNDRQYLISEIQCQ